MIKPGGSFVEFPPEDVERSVPWCFERRVEKHRDRLAVKCGGVEITYDALNRTANRIARAVLTADGEGEGQVCTVFGHDPANIAAIMGALKTGKTFVPLDPLYPYERIAYMLGDCQARTIVTDNGNLELAKRLADGAQRIVNVDAMEKDFADDNLGIEVGPDARSYILYTSGSTGNPKGVVHVHRNVLNFIRNIINNLYLSVEDRMTHMMSTSFGASLSCYLAPLLSGGSTHMFDPKRHGPMELAQWLMRDRITFFYSVPSLFRAVAAALTPGMDFPNLRVIRLGGEAVTPADVEVYRKHFPGNAVLTNAYGSTEATVVTQYSIGKDTELKTKTVPAGYECGGAEALVLDDDFNELGPGEVGHIAVKSRYLALGYWRRPDLTEKVFLPAGDGSGRRIYLTGDMGRMDEHRCFEILGRKDFQVKVRGYRVETPEIEAALVKSGLVREAAVVAREDEPGGSRLVAYIVADGPSRPTVGQLREGLRSRLPEYMIPSAFVFLDRLPLTPNGKLDRRALPAVVGVRGELATAFVAPRTPVEETLATIWAEVLQLDRVGVEDNFLELGGHSLLAGQVVSRAVRAFQLDIPLVWLFEAPTVARMAMTITQALARRARPEHLERMLDEAESSSDKDRKEFRSGRSRKRRNS